MAEEIKYNPETVKAVLDVLQKEFETEEGRNRFITSKVQMMLTLASVLLTAIAFLLKAIIEQSWYIKLNATLLLLAMLIIIAAIVRFLNVIRIKTFKRIKYEALIFELEKNPIEVESRLIVTYEEALKGNIPITNDMTKIFQKGTLLITIAIYIICVVLLTILSVISKTFSWRYL